MLRMSPADVAAWEGSEAEAGAGTSRGAQARPGSARGGSRGASGDGAEERASDVPAAAGAGRAPPLFLELDEWDRAADDADDSGDDADDGGDDADDGGDDADDADDGGDDRDGSGASDGAASDAGGGHADGQAASSASALRKALPPGNGAGLIPLFSTNLSELCLWYEATNPVYGRSNNPYDLLRTVGGSSGGEACVVASGAVPLGVGSDIGGSIRMPAAFNGVFGHKPTGGLVPGTGQFPFATTRLLCTGPIARYAEDLWPALCVVAGADADGDAACRGQPLSVFGLIRAAGFAGPGPGAGAGAGAAGPDPPRNSCRGGPVRRSPAHAGRTPIPDLPFVAGADSGPGPCEVPEEGPAEPAAGRVGGVLASPATEAQHAGRHAAVGSGSHSGSPPRRASSSARVRRRRKPAERSEPRPLLVPGGGVPATSSAPRLSQTQVCKSVRGTPAFRRYARLRAPVGGAPWREGRPSLPRAPAPPVPCVEAGWVRGPHRINWADVTVFCVPDLASQSQLLASPCTTGVEGALSAQDATALALCSRLGCKGVERLALPELTQAFSVWSAALQAEEPTPQSEFLADRRPSVGSRAPALRLLLARLCGLPLTAASGCAGLGGGPARPAKDGWDPAVVDRPCVGRGPLGCLRHGIPALGLGVLEPLQARLIPRLYAAMARSAVALRRRLSETLSAGSATGGGGILVFPTHPVAAPPHNAPLFEFVNVAFTAIFNAATLPATSVPVTLLSPQQHSAALAQLAAAPGRSLTTCADAQVPDTRLPLGVQLVSGLGMDHLTIGAALRLDQTVVPVGGAALERSGVGAARFGWRPPPCCVDAGITPGARDLPLG
ncbi:hypothetical protein FNF27_05400 [Cafeteria roenbergensis]|uniref:Amidase domain-containing protein n=3 Tax=Cafeteria roenbergensis TaxID=33653 RepID=A0A5A8E5U5_CAFRO|nr:hypothetical protein FNF27_05400 [Cafeteria roenbergensis]